MEINNTIRCIKAEYQEVTSDHEEKNPFIDNR